LSKLEEEEGFRNRIVKETEVLRERLIGGLQKASLKIKELERMNAELIVSKSKN
jgi:transposase